MKSYETLKAEKPSKRKLPIEDLHVNKKSTQQYLTAYRGVQPAAVPKQIIFEQKLQRFIVNGMFPLSMVESEEFEDLLKCK